MIETVEEIQADIDRMLDEIPTREGEDPIDALNRMLDEKIAEQNGELELNSAETVDKSAESGIIEEKEPISVYDEYEQNKDAINETLHQVEKEKEQLNYEVGTIIDRQGNVINVTGGEAHSVDPPKDLLIDSIFTHNHPSGHCFSDDDIINAVKDQVLELRASTPQGIYYSLLRTEKADGSAELGKEYSKAIWNKELRKRVEYDLKSGVITKNEATDQYLNYISKAGEEFLTQNAEKYGYIFTIGVR